MKATTSLLVLGCALHAATASADPHFSVSPSVSLATLYDDNLFIDVRKESDFVARLTPGVALDFKADQLRVKADYHQDLEHFFDHSDLDSAVARQAADLRAEYRATRRLTFNAYGSYLAAPTTGELNLTSGLELGRLDSTRRAAGAGVNYLFSRESNGGVGYNKTQNRSDNGINGNTEEAYANFNHTLTPTVTLLLGDTFRRFTYDNFPDEQSNTPTVGVAWQYSATTNMRIQGGPRHFSDSVKPEIFAALQHKFARGEMLLNYTRSESVLAGVTGKAETSFTELTYSRQLDGPLKLTVKPSYGSVSNVLGSAKIYRMEVGATYNVNEQTELAATWQYSRQHDQLASGPVLNIPRNLFMLSINLVYPTRQERL